MGNMACRTWRCKISSLSGPLLLGEARALTLTNVNFYRYSPIFYAVDDLNCGVMNNGVLPTFTDTDVTEQFHQLLLLLLPLFEEYHLELRVPVDHHLWQPAPGGLPGDVPLHLPRCRRD